MRKTIFSAVFTLSVFTVVDRALGFVFKIYLSRELGAELLGVYQVALSFFFVLLTATTSGIPLIVSKLTARYRLSGELRRERALTAAALVSGLTVAAVIIGLSLLLYLPMKSAFTSPESATTLLFFLPALAFSSVYSAFRGNLWGRQRYFAVSTVEIIEQIARIAVCIILFALGCNKLYSAAASLSIGCFVSTVAVTVLFFVAKGRLRSPKGEIAPLLRSATPITVSRAASSFINSLIAIAVPSLLIASGYSDSDALGLFGSSVGMALPLLYIPITVVGSLAFVMIPTVSEGVGRGDFSRVNAQIESATGFAIIIAALFVPMFLALGEPIGRFVYGNETAGKFLSASAWLLIPLSVENITSSVMNSLDLEIRSFVNYLIGSAVSFIIMFAFYGSFRINLLGLALGVGWSTTCVLHLLSIRKKIGLRMSFAGKGATAVLLIVPTVFATKCTFNLMGGLPLFASITLASLVSLVFFALAAPALGLVDVDFFRSKVKTSVKCDAKKKFRLFGAKSE